MYQMKVVTKEIIIGRVCLLGLRARLLKTAARRYRGPEDVSSRLGTARQVPAVLTARPAQLLGLAESQYAHGCSSRGSRACCRRYCSPRRATWLRNQNKLRTHAPGAHPPARRIKTLLVAATCFCFRWPNYATRDRLSFPILK